MGQPRNPGRSPCRRTDARSLGWSIPDQILEQLQLARGVRLGQLGCVRQQFPQILAVERLQRHLLDHGVQGDLQAELVAEDRHQGVDRDGYPQLRLDRILRRAQEALHAQVLLDEFKKQFDLPALFVEIADGRGRPVGAIGQQDQPFLRGGIPEVDAAQAVRIGGGRPLAGEDHHLVGPDSAIGLLGIRMQPAQLQILLRTNDEERTGLLEAIEPLEIHVGSIHDIRGTRFRPKFV